jgi:nucleotide-binding universal stress UspA family protein
VAHRARVQGRPAVHGEAGGRMRLSRRSHTKGSAVNDVDSEGGILVGVPRDGHLSEDAIGWLVRTAQRLGVGLDLVHVVPVLVGGPTGSWDVGISLDHLVTQGRSALDETVERVRQRMAGAQPVSGQLLRGGVIATLVERSAFAQLVVLEHRDLSRMDRLGQGSVTAGVAARAHAPVVSVPASWRPAQDVRPITVGVEDATRADSELWTALGLAAVMDLPVVALRVAYVAPAWEELMLHQDSHEDLLLVGRDELARDADLPASVCERVPCTFEVRWGRPVDVLVEATWRSSLLVLARRDPRLRFGSHLGPVVREVLRRAECPVLIVEPSLPRPIRSVGSRHTLRAAAG